jgi:biopolymer transport protein ExbB
VDGFHPIAEVREFLEVGGGVLVVITLAIIAMWSLIFERFWYFWRVRGQELPHAAHADGIHRDRVLEHALHVRHQEMSRRLPMIRALISVCPLLGLLGTVLGMIEVFEVTALTGGGNVRAIASGVSRATITTMAGLVASLSGLFLLAALDRHVWNDRRRAEHRLGLG